MCKVMSAQVMCCIRTGCGQIPQQKLSSYSPHAGHFIPLQHRLWFHNLLTEDYCCQKDYSALSYPTMSACSPLPYAGSQPLCELKQTIIFRLPPLLWVLKVRYLNSLFVRKLSLWLWNLRTCSQDRATLQKRCTFSLAIMLARTS